ncbi:MAG TPA: FAD-dependent oxidoreductase [Dehalococcoidales bacterium]|nr:FAD-dependent oxidoreductase [Dehalococcoidales bacterium]
MNTRFQKLLEPSYIGKVKTRNRIIKTAQGSSFIEPDGYVGEQAKAYYETMAKGGVGLLIVESCGVEYPLGIHHFPVQFHLDDDKYIPGYTELVQVVHKHGCPIFLQLFHSGPWNPTGLLPKRDTKSASTLTEAELPGPRFAIPRGVSLAEIEDLIQMFVKASQRAKKAGFDGVEINAATCHLINSFYSRIFNKREDEFGCASLENRARFLNRIIIDTKKQLGTDFAVTALINIAEYGHEKATTFEEGVQFARLAAEAGADAIQVRAHGYGHRGGLLQPDRLFYPEFPKPLPKDLDWSHRGVGAIIPLAQAVKKVVSVPVIAACRLDPVLGEKLLQQGDIDFVGMTRRLLADPELPNKVAAGNLEDINPCTGCLYCMDVRLHNTPIRCRINANLGREREFALKPAAKIKQVLVIGGGPSGMEAARVAALRGHKVTICEKTAKLGGLLPLASMLKDIETDELLALIKYLDHQMTKAGVTVKLNTEVDAALIAQLKPDVVIVAAGGIDSIMDIPGINGKNIVTGAKLHGQLKFYSRFFSPKTLARLTKVWMPIGKNVVVIGGTIHGCELAEFLIKRGRKVTIIHSGTEIGEGMTGDDQFQFLRWIAEKDAAIITGATVDKITKNGLSIKIGGKEQTIVADTIALALPLQSNPSLLKQLEGKLTEIYAIGDCNEPHLIADAIAGGSRIGHSI